MAEKRLTDDQVIEICAKYSTGAYTQIQLAEEYGITQGNVSHIIRKRTHRAVHTEINFLTEDISNSLSPIPIKNSGKFLSI